MPRFNRFNPKEVEEKADEAQHIMVPDLSVFGKDFMNRWLSRLSSEGNLRQVNPSLLLQKYPWWFDDGHKISMVQRFHKLRQGRSPKAMDRNYKTEILQSVCDCLRARPHQYEDIRDRHFSVPAGYQMASRVLETRTRLLAGHSGSGSVLESGIALHPWYGFPFIPGPSLKGVTLHFRKDYPNDVTSDQAGYIFGGADRQGSAVFYDAWPEEWPGSDGLLEIDVMTPHYQEYYQGRKLPSDDQNPIPLFFLAVRKGVRFRFAARARSIGDAETAVSWLEETLTTVGVGAKTGSSYGYFKKPGKGGS